MKFVIAPPFRTCHGRMLKTAAMKLMNRNISPIDTGSPGIHSPTNPAISEAGPSPVLHQRDFLMVMSFLLLGESLPIFWAGRIFNELAFRLDGKKRLGDSCSLW